MRNAPDGTGALERADIVITEWLTTTASDREDAESFTNGLILTYKGDVIVPYPPAMKLSIWELKDVDNDGRPDIRTTLWRPSRARPIPVIRGRRRLHHRREISPETERVIDVEPAVLLK